MENVERGTLDRELPNMIDAERRAGNNKAKGAVQVTALSDGRAATLDL